MRVVCSSRLAACLIGSVFAQSAHALTDQEAKSAADVVAAKYENLFNAGDPNAIANLFSVDGTYLTPLGAVLTTRSAIEAGVSARLKNGQPKLTEKIMEAHSAGNDVWATGEYTLTLSDGKPISGHFAYVLVPDRNDWRLRMAISNITPSK